VTNFGFCSSGSDLDPLFVPPFPLVLGVLCNGVCQGFINWILELDPRLHLAFSNHELSSELFFLFGLDQLIFPPKWCHVGLVLICLFFGLGPLSKGHGTNLQFSANSIALFHWRLNLRPSSKVALICIYPNFRDAEIHSSIQVDPIFTTKGLKHLGGRGRGDLHWT
jgi:hypothetical protein